MPWRVHTYVAVDLEGTGGQDAQREEILDIALIEIRDGRVTEKIFHSLLNPGRRFRRLPWLPHDITNEQVATAASFVSIIPVLMEFVNGRVLVAHNARVDWRLLKRKCPDLRPLAVLDTLRLARTLYPEMKGRGGFSLRSLEKQLGLPTPHREESGTPHRALADSMLTAALLLHMLSERFPPEGSLVQLFDICGIDPPSEEGGVRDPGFSAES